LKDTNLEIAFQSLCRVQNSIADEENKWNTAHQFRWDSDGYTNVCD